MAGDGICLENRRALIAPWEIIPLCLRLVSGAARCGHRPVTSEKQMDSNSIGTAILSCGGIGRRSLTVSGVVIKEGYKIVD